MRLAVGPLPSRQRWQLPGCWASQPGLNNMPHNRRTLKESCAVCSARQGSRTCRESQKDVAGDAVGEGMRCIEGPRGAGQRTAVVQRVAVRHTLKAALRAPAEGGAEHGAAAVINMRSTPLTQGTGCAGSRQILGARDQLCHPRRQCTNSSEHGTADGGIPGHWGRLWAPLCLLLQG